MKTTITMMTLLLAVSVIPFVVLQSNAQDLQPSDKLTIKQMMNAMLTPMTNIIWGAQALDTEAQRQEVENAALTIIGAANLIAQGGADGDQNNWSQESDWQQFNNDMIAAAKATIDAVAAQDMDALFAAGNDQLYPPCENCHQKYQSR